ncbi:MAG: 3-isopropylmalate dehydratase large subunit [Cyanobacteriota bacterium]
MPQTLAEKILSLASGKNLKAGQTAIVPLSLAYFQDGTGPLGLRQLEKLNIKKLANPEKSIFFIDHSAPSPRKELSNDHMFIRDFAKSTGAIVHDVGDGVCHQIAAESYVRPGDVVIGGDSHTCTGGAFAAFATGMGSTDVAIGMALGKTWFRVPETIKVELKGYIPRFVTSKDIILHLIGLIGADGATYKSLEFCGDFAEKLPMPERLTISNMAVEAGAKVGLFASDNKTKQYLAKYGRENDYKEISSDPDAYYEQVITIEVDKLTPVVACPHTVDNTKPVSQVKNIKIDQVFIGTCTNGRIEDLRYAACVFKDRKVKARTIITPASRDVFIQASKEGLIETILKAGATIMTPGCGACVGVHGGILGDDENCLATQNRNFQGRMGNPKGNIYLSSPIVAACSAITGVITDPDEFFGN